MIVRGRESKAHRSIWEYGDRISFEVTDTWDLGLNAEILFCHIPRSQEYVAFGNSVFDMNKWRIERSRKFWEIQRRDSVISSQYLVVLVQYLECYFVLFLSYDDVVLVCDLYGHFCEIDRTKRECVGCDIGSVDTE